MEYQTAPTEYQLNGVSKEDVQKEVDKFLQLVATDANAQKEVTDAGLNLPEVRDALREAGSEKPIQIRPAGSGLGPVTIAVAVASVKLGAKILEDLWTYVILPRIRDRKGEPSIQPVKKQG